MYAHMTCNSLICIIMYINNIYIYIYTYVLGASKWSAKVCVCVTVSPRTNHPDVQGFDSVGL